MTCQAACPALKQHAGDAAVLMRQWPDLSGPQAPSRPVARVGQSSSDMGQAWQDLTEAASYPFARACLGSLRAMLSSGAWRGRMRSGGFGRYVALGGGGAPKKDRALLAAIGAARATQGRPDFLWLDASRPMLDVSRQAASRLSSRIAVQSFIEGDILDPSVLADLPRRPGATLWTLLGATFGNLDETRFAEALEKTAQPGDWLALGVDLRDRMDPEGQAARLLAIYQSPELARYHLSSIDAAQGGEVGSVMARVAEACREGRSGIPGSLSLIIGSPASGEFVSNRYDGNFLRAWWERRGWRQVGMFAGASGAGRESETYRQILMERL